MSRESSGAYKRDLRPIHMPGSVGFREARNLYFGERYDEKALLKSATKLLSSICIGPNVAICFADEFLQRDLRKCISDFGQHILGRDLRELMIHDIENDKPYICVLKLLLWLYDHAKARGYSHVIDLIRKTEGMIYFAPGVERAKYSTIPLPRLDVFFHTWLDKTDRRNVLKTMRDTLYHFTQRVRINARRKKETKIAQDKLNLLTTYYDMLCERVLKSCLIDLELLRRMTDIVLELSERYNVHMSLSFIKGLLK